MLSLRFAFMIVATPTACAIALWRPFWGLLCLVFLYYFRPEIWEAPEWFRPIFWITVAVGVGWATRERKLRWHPALTLFVLLLFALFASGLQAVFDAPAAVDAVIVVGKLMVAGFLTFQLIDSAQKLSWFLWANVLGMIWNMKTVLVQGITGVGVTEDVRVDVNVGQGGGANYLAMIFVMFMPILLSKFQDGTRRERRLAIGLLPLMTLCLIYTGSRSGFLATFGIMLHQFVRAKRKGPAFLGIVVMAILVYLVTPAEHWTRFSQGMGDKKERDFSAESRILLWKAGITMFRNYPILGVGLDNYQHLSPKYAGFYAGRDFEAYQPGLKRPGFVAHNTWVQSLAEGGVVCSLPFFALYLFSFWYIWQARRTLPKWHPEWRSYYSLSVIFEGMFLGILVCSIFGSYMKVDFLWWFFGAVAALHTNAKDRLAELEEATAIARRKGAGTGVKAGLPPPVGASA